MGAGEKVIRPDIFRRVRATLGWTQQDLADGLEVAVATVSRWEKDGAKKVVGYALGGLLVEHDRVREAADILWSQEDIFSD